MSQVQNPNSFFKKCTGLTNYTNSLFTNVVFGRNHGDGLQGLEVII